MKKILLVAVIGILLLSGMEAVALNTNIKNPTVAPGEKEVYTHTVLVEVGTAQWCGPCASWNTNIYNTYTSGSYDFEYVEMIYSDHNHNTLNTLASSWMNIYNPTYIPASIFDGDFQRLEGNYPSQLASVLNTCGQRTVRDIEASLSLDWLGNATIAIEIQIINHEATQYVGHIRVPISELVSRYDTATGSDYHHGFLDYAFPMNTAISIAPGDTYTNSVTWVGSEHQDGHGQNFGDVTADNIQVILGVFNNENNYVDETVAATIGGVYTPKNPNPEDGATGVDVNSDLSWTGGPSGVTYDVYFGTTSPPPKVAGNHSGTTYDLAALNFQTTYYWKIVGWDDQGNSAEGPIWHFTTLTNPNNAPTVTDFTGPLKGKPGLTYKYTVTATDLDQDQLYCYVEWGDNSTTDWTGPFSSGNPFSVTHTWDVKGTYTVKIKVKDEHGAESSWATLDVKMPTSFVFSHPLIKWLFENFPMLQQLFGI
jgi:hypothetical protein